MLKKDEHLGEENSEKSQNPGYQHYQTPTAKERREAHRTDA
jgi:hypothetical protein